MGDDRPFVCSAPGCGQRFTNEDHLAVHKHKHEMTLKFGPARTDSVIIADQTPTPTRFLKNCEEVGLFNELASSFEQEDDDKRAKNSVRRTLLQTSSDVKVKKEAPVEVDSSPPDSPESIASKSDHSREPLDTPPRSSAPTPTIVRPGSLPLHLGFDALQPTMPSPTSVITQAPPSNRTNLGWFKLTIHMYLCVLYGLQLARPMCMVPNIPGIPGPPLGGSSSGSNSPSGYSIPSEAKMVSTSLALYFCLSICFFCLHFYPPGFLCTGLVSPAQPTGGRRRRTLDDDPDERRQRFLERNRAAASRCRQKRKLWVSSLEKKAEELCTLNVSLSNEVSLLRNEVAHLKQLLLAHKDCPVTTLQKKTAYLGSPAPVIQHSSLAPSPSVGQNGLSSRAAAEAMAMSVLAGMGQQPRAESGPSHIIMATQSQSAAR
uniref:Uncharacterized protein n=1 Tax=Mola mola TaxID=94237 RepID=A0A3Q3W3H1_MOLML